MPLFRILTAILLAGFLPGVRARQNCWIDSNGFEHCDDRLSSGARAAIGLGFRKCPLLLPHRSIPPF
ncbi:hypothetical protein BJV78DRAFT_1246416 [Lactifluus subvellereus]|nr:hypothetical protein BJV78DRAFT_1246416 [Lactifluus subvellereus]